MEIPAISLATSIAKACSDYVKCKKSTVRQLATALCEGVGAVRQETYLFVVLASPLELSEDKPVFVAGKCRTPQLTSMKNVSAFLRRRTVDAIKPSDCRRSWVPSTTSTAALLPLGGNLAEPVATTEGSGATYTWYNLEAVPVGGIVYRLDAVGVLHVFQRLNTDAWSRSPIQAADQFKGSPLVAAMNKLCAEHGSISGLTRTSDCTKLGLLCKPPQ